MMKTLTVFIVVIFAVLLLVGLVAARASRYAANAPAVGTPAPDFTLNAQDGKPVSLQDFRGQWVVLYFYPKDFTSGCTKEAHNFQRDLPLFEQKHAIILGVSGQDEGSHEKFCTAEGLHFKLLADLHCKLSARYGSVVDLGVAKLSARHTFLIDPAGIIRKVYLKVDPSKHSAELLADLAQLQKESKQ
ncbi:MAG TPA: peroxiredoxin [Candidatus Acidoferrum sp.]|nr:peroxiredoxin [Candidatus Acidoferrum sp.]